MSLCKLPFSWLYFVVVFCAFACGESSTDKPPAEDTVVDTTPTDSCGPSPTDIDWQVLKTCQMEGQFLSVWGTGPTDVWVVGAKGLVRHFDGCQWDAVDVGTEADLWWVTGFDDGSVTMVGSEGTILRGSLEQGFAPMDSGVTVTLYGVWGTAADRMWTVGFAPDNSAPGVVLTFDGQTWEPVTGLPESGSVHRNFFKVWGTGDDDIWVVGRDDLILHWDGQQWSDQKTGMDEDWVTVTGRVKTSGTADVIVVGGRNQGTILQGTTDGWKDVSLEGYPPLQGVCAQPNGEIMATGVGATILRRTPGLIWSEALNAPFDVVNPVEPPVPGCKLPTPDYHACYADGAGGFFLVGGHFFGGLTEGAILHYGPKISAKGL